MIDVIVVGAGPAGLYSALLLAEEGFDVTVLEEHDALGVPTHCTGVVSDELSSLFKIPESLVLSRPTLCSVFTPSGRALPVSSSGEAIAVIDRAQFDLELGSAAQRAGVELRTGSRVHHISADRRGVRVVGADGVGLAARACVLAAGVNYRLQRQLGLGLPSLFLHSAQLEVDVSEAGGAVEIHLGAAVAPDGFAWTVPVLREGRPRMKLGLMVRGDAAGYLQRFLRRPALSSRLGPDAGAPIRRLLPLGPIAKTYAERVLVVGDAAGLTKPTTGGGIFYSLVSAAVAAEVLAAALGRDRLGDEDLRAYETRWRARLGPHLRISTYVRRLFMKLTDAEIETVLDAIAADDVQGLLRRGAHFNWHGPLIRSILREPGVKSVVLRALLR